MIHRISNILNEFSKAILFILISSMTVIVFSQVVLRYIFNESLVWSEEVARYAFIWASFIGASIASKRATHIGVRIFIEMFPYKIKKKFEILINIFILIFLVVVLYSSIQITVRAWHQWTAVLELRMTYPYLALPLGILFMIIHHLDRMIEMIKFKKIYI
jgi:TRAP-type C4-dicarboxylate transport system permease small subunit